MSLYELRLARELRSPVLVVGMEGWVDAGLGAAAATAYLLEELNSEVMAEFDADELIDHRARRPVVRIDNGVNVGLSWPEIQLRVGRDRAGRDVLLLVGPEPDMRWHAFVRAVVSLAVDMGVRLVCGLGAFPAPVPHTRPVRVVSTATTEDLAQRVGHVTATIDVSAGIEAALEQGFAAASVPAVGLWARVPHYVAGMPYPAASVALLDTLADVAGIELDPTELRTTAAVTAQRLAQLIANSPDHGEMIRQLEAQVDAEEWPLDLSDLPSGDEIAAELQRYLLGNGERGDGGGPGDGEGEPGDGGGEPEER